MRRQDWPRRLREFVRARRAMPFEWGANDCVTLAADWIEDCTGRVIPRGWTDAVSAMREIKDRGGLQQAVTAELGDPIDWRFAQRGDVVLVVIDARETMSVCVGDHLLVPGEAGGLLHPVTEETMVGAVAWRVV